MRISGVREWQEREENGVKGFSGFRHIPGYLLFSCHPRHLLHLLYLFDLGFSVVYLARPCTFG